MSRTKKDQPKEKGKPKFKNSRNDRYGGIALRLNKKYKDDQKLYLPYVEYIPDEASIAF